MLRDTRTCVAAHSVALRPVVLATHNVEEARVDDKDDKEEHHGAQNHKASNQLQPDRVVACTPTSHINDMLLGQFMCCVADCNSALQNFVADVNKINDFSKWKWS